MKTESSRNPLKSTLRACRATFRTIGVFSGFANVLMLVPAFFMLNVYDKAVGSNSVPTLWSLSLIAFFMLVMLCVLEILRSRLLVHTSSRIDRLLAPTIFDMQFERAIHEGGFGASQSLVDLNGLRQFLTSTGVIAFFDAPWLPVYLVILFLFHPVFGWMGVLATIVLFALVVLNQRATQSSLIEANSKAGVLQNKTTRQLTNIDVAASMGMKAVLKKQWRADQEDILALQESSSRGAGTYGAVIKSVRIIVQSGAIAAGAYLVLIQEISPGMIIAGSILIGRALQPVEQAVGAWRGLQEARQQYQRLSDLTEKFPLRAEQFSLPAIKGALTVANASINAPMSKAAIVSGATFDIQSGSITFILGPSGAGKSTLIRGLLGVWKTSEGVIRIDGAEAASYDRTELGAQIGYLPQAIELFEGSIAENISRFRPATADDVIQAAKDANVHDLILSLQDGYDTQIGPNTGALSPGQQQRIALARAAFGRPRLVVLDEPNSNLDEAGDNALANAIQILKVNGSTVIVVSHRKELLHLADNVVLMAKGTVADFGPLQDVAARLRAPAPKNAASTTTVEKPTAHLVPFTDHTVG